MMESVFKSRFGWWLIFLSALMPVVFLAYRVAINDLGVEPGVTVLEYLGTTAIVFLFITLSVTPLKKWLKIKWLLRYRRMLGLYCLFYAIFHAASYGLFIVDWADFVGALYKRPYVVMGALALIILITLGLTSPKSVVRGMGRKWKTLHRSIYLCAGVVVVHVWWQSRSDFFEPFMYMVVFIVLMVARIDFWRSLVNK